MNPNLRDNEDLFFRLKIFIKDLLEFSECLSYISIRYHEYYFTTPFQMNRKFNFSSLIFSYKNILIQNFYILSFKLYLQFTLNYIYKNFCAPRCTREPNGSSLI